jgi:DNA-binding transcriptional ArsR family regulator
VLCSKTRIKILKLVIELSQLNPSEIARRLGINHAITQKHLNLLSNQGVVQFRRYGRIKLYRLSESSLKAKAIQELIETWRNT